MALLVSSFDVLFYCPLFLPKLVVSALSFGNHGSETQTKGNIERVGALLQTIRPPEIGSSVGSLGMNIHLTQRLFYLSKSYEGLIWTGGLVDVGLNAWPFS